MTNSAVLIVWPGSGWPGQMKAQKTEEKLQNVIQLLVSNVHFSIKFLIVSTKLSVVQWECKERMVQAKMARIYLNCSTHMNCRNSLFRVWKAAGIRWVLHKASGKNLPIWGTLFKYLRRGKALNYSMTIFFCRDLKHCSIHNLLQSCKPSGGHLVQLWPRETLQDNYKRWHIYQENMEEGKKERLDCYWWPDRHF